MNIFKIIFLASVIAFSPLSYSTSGDMIHSSAYLSGTVKAFYIAFEIQLRNNDGSGKQDPYGRIKVKHFNGNEVNVLVWDIDDDDYLSDTNTIRVQPGFPFLASELKDNYITLEGEIRDDDGATSDDRLCYIDSNVLIHQSDVGKEFTRDGDGIFYGGDHDCRYLKLTRFELVR